MNKHIVKISLLTGIGVFVFAGCAEQNNIQPTKTIYKVEKNNYILKSDAKVKKAVALLIINQRKLKKRVNKLETETNKNKISKKQNLIKGKVIKSKETSYDKVILNFVKKDKK